MPHHSSMHSIAKQTLPLCCSLRHLTQPSSIPLHPVRPAGMFSCCLNRCSALVSSATLLRQRYEYIYIFSSACWRIYTTISTLIQLGLRGRPSRMYLLYYQLLQQHGGTDSPALPTYIHLIFVLATTTTNINLQRASLPLKFVG